MTETPEAVLLPYQQDLIAATAAHQVVVCEKSRRIGMTWGVAADAVLTAGAARAAGGQDVFYIGYNRDMTREFIDTCAMWAKSFLGVAAEVGEFLFIEQDARGETREIQAFRINFASDFEIVALCSRPRSLRGRQGYVIIDEAAFHDELAELLKAAIALLIWGGKVLIISTHDGDDNPFNLLITEIKSEKKPYALIRVTFDEAIKQGLYRRVCLRRGIEWTPEGEAAWAQEIRDFYGDAAAEELDCVPAKSGGRYLSRVLLEARAVDVPVVRWSLPAEWVDLPEDDRVRIVDEFCVDQLAPLLGASSASSSSVGVDFGRSGHLSVFWALATAADLRRSTAFVVELRNVPFRAQEQILFWIIDRLTRCTGVALDARGNGQYLAEATRQRYGPDFVAEVMLSEGWYREHMPPLRAALEDDTLTIPRDAEIVSDLRSIEVVRGVARAPERARKTADGERHGDAAIAAALALFAARTIDGGPIDIALEGRFTSLDAFGGDTGGGWEGWL